MIQYSVVTDEPDFLDLVTLAEAKTHLEYTGTAKNTYITSLIQTAGKLCEIYTGLSFVTQIRRVKLDYFPSNPLYIQLPYGPVQHIDTFSYTTEDDTTETLVSGTDYLLDTHSRVARVYPIGSDGTIDTWPTDYKSIPHPITIDYQTGYDDVSGEPVPEQVKQAVMMYVAKMYEKRGDEQGKTIAEALPWECQVILDSIKVTWNANYE